MNRWKPWQRPAAKARRRAIPTLEPLEDRCVMSAAGFTQVNLASDIPGLAHVTVPSLVNPWGISFSPTGPFWFSDTGAGASTLLDGRGQVVPLSVSVPGTGGTAGAPTGTVLNAGSGFVVSANGHAGPSGFLFASIDGTISGWSEDADISSAVVAVDNSSLHAVYTGLALTTNGAGQSFLYAADFSLGRIDVFDQNFQPVVNAGAFEDPNLPSGFAPFNIQNIGGRLYVTYAQQSAPGNGVVDVYNPEGALLSRFAAAGALDAPWAVTLAPAGFGRFGGDLLIGNNGDGRINAFNPTTGAYLGQLADDAGTPIAIDNLWGLTFGNGHEGGNADTLFFASGYDDGAHGLFGAIQPPLLRGADTGGAGVFDPNAPGEPFDYPLPPVQGPALQETSHTTRAVSVLLPLTESSLALVPTLTVVPQQAIVAPAPTPGNQVVVAALEGTSATVSRYVAHDSTPASSEPAPSVTIGSFLDLNAAPGTPAELTVRHRVVRPIDIASRTSFVDDDTQPMADAALSEAWSQEPTRTPTVAPTPSAPADAIGSKFTWMRVLGSLLGVLAINAVAEYLPARLRRTPNRIIALRDNRE